MTKTDEMSETVGFSPKLTFQVPVFEEVVSTIQGPEMVEMDPTRKSLYSVFTLKLVDAKRAFLRLLLLELMFLLLWE